MKNSLGKANCRLDTEERRINEPEGTTTDSNQNETQKEKTAGKKWVEYKHAERQLQVI